MLNESAAVAAIPICGEKHATSESLRDEHPHDQPALLRSLAIITQYCTGPIAPLFVQKRLPKWTNKRGEKFWRKITQFCVTRYKPDSLCSPMIVCCAAQRKRAQNLILQLESFVLFRLSYGRRQAQYSVAYLTRSSERGGLREVGAGASDKPAQGRQLPRRKTAEGATV